MPPWWGKSSSKEVKKTAKENLIDTFQRLISSNEQKGSKKSRGSRRHGKDTAGDKGCWSTAQSRSTSPSKEVSRCQSFAADRPHAQPLPLPKSRARVSRSSSDITNSKSTLEKHGKGQLLPLPPIQPKKTPEATEPVTEVATASVSSNCSIDSDDPGDSRLQIPVGNETENATRITATSSSSVVHKERSSAITRKNTKEVAKPNNVFLSNQILSTSPRGTVADGYQSNLQSPRQIALESAPNSLMSSPSRSPRIICPDQIPTSAFWAVKPHTDVTFLGSGQCSSPGSGQTSGHNSVGGDMLGPIFWQPSRGSPECSPIPSPRMTSPGPSSRVHSGSVSPLHPRAGGVTPESPTNRHAEGNKKQTHRLPLPPLSIANSSTFLPNSSTPASPISRSPGRTENPPSPGSRWKKGKLIGRGTFGHVYAGFNRHVLTFKCYHHHINNGVLASYYMHSPLLSLNNFSCNLSLEVTLFSDDPKSKESAKQLCQEISLLSRLQHPNIVRYYGSETVCTAVDDKLYIYLEYVSGGSIHKLLQEYGQFGEQAIRSYTKQILLGLAFLHAKNTVHRDIKGANILVDPNGRVKLADFGMAKHVIKNASGCNLAVDIWSLGCTVLEMATSKPPWSQYEGVSVRLYSYNLCFCSEISLLGRPTAVDLLQHPFVGNAPPLEKSSASNPLEQLTTISCRTNWKVVEHARNMSSLGLEGRYQSILQRRAAKFSLPNSDIRIQSNISCPVSPCGSPLLRSRSPQHQNGRMSPSPISSPRTTSGASTPLTGGSGAVPLNHLRQPAYRNEGFTVTSRGFDDHIPSRLVDPVHGRFIRVQQLSAGRQERVVSEADILSSQFGKMRHANVWDPHDRPLPSERSSQQCFGDHAKLKPSLDLRSGPLHPGRNHGH
ncbi:Putative MAPKKK family protein kinase isoform 1 [Zea mays]|uniref:Putative MAPKKK family protein kinase isoform 1 n=1 Tax=Zea mays TaxID=4577 RepID=A0A1D6Q6M9_MAIZE|nr:Putative MAPKKK family protein kinase isoform 1 [Zea mays]